MLISWTQPVDFAVGSPEILGFPRVSNLSSAPSNQRFFLGKEFKIC